MVVDDAILERIILRRVRNVRLASTSSRRSLELLGLVARI
jgi:hypothetical protein